jgi:hypothetical protein
MNASLFRSLCLGIALGIPLVRAGAQTWVQTSAPVTNWSCVASSADGTILAAGISGDYGNNPSGPIYVSTNSGATWWATASPVTKWASVASSGDGSTLFGVNFNAPPYPVHVSTNFGAAWSSIPVPSDWWYFNAGSVACSADARTVIAGLGDIAGTAYASWVFITTNAGGAWSSRRESAWRASVACSADGKTMLAGFRGEWPQNVLISTNSGDSWQNGPLDSWSAAACSGDGSTMLASGAGKQIWLSTNGGDVWGPITNPPNLTGDALALSTDGTTMVAISRSGSISSSGDRGATWTTDNAPLTNWSCVALSADGCRAVTAVQGGGIYIRQTTPTPMLNITRSSNGLLLSWIVPSTVLSLQQTSDLSAPSWWDVPTIPSFNYTNLHYEVTLSLPPEPIFYRLASK